MFDSTDHLERDNAIRFELLGLVHDAHAALAQDAENFIARHAGIIATLFWRQTRGDGVSVPGDLHVLGTTLRFRL